MSNQLCIHGHFYQPPREDPWMNRIFPEGSAAPFKHWNQRICRESYAPLAWARRLDGEGRIIELVNCYEWMSFNFGPTLMAWLQRSAYDTYERIVEADKKSVERLGHGNAMAQIYHHMIMPLAKDRDKKVEVAWAVADFQARYGRDPEGLWLSETAVDNPTLEILAEFGIKFTILAPRQAREIAPVGTEDWRGVQEHEVDVRRPYLVELPSGRTISVFFYNGPISQAVAFEGLLSDGEKYWNKLRENLGHGLLSVGTDGETYGHHFAFGEMALAYVLDQARSHRDDVELTNYATYLEANPPDEKVRIHEKSSWSCYHGVERWRSDCGCCTGGHPGWNQGWRTPLRRASDFMKEKVDSHFDDLGRDIFKDPSTALMEFGRVVSGAMGIDDYCRENMNPKVSEDQKNTGLRLLTMQKWALSSMASCAWFFDDIGRIEPLNSMTFALRAMEIGAATGMEDIEPGYRDIMAKAVSNEPELGTGRDLWLSRVKPRQEHPQTVINQALVRMKANECFPQPGGDSETSWPGVAVKVDRSPKSTEQSLFGKAYLRWEHESICEIYDWKWEDGNHTNPFAGCVTSRSDDKRTPEFCLSCSDMPWEKRQALAMEYIERKEHKAWNIITADLVEASYLFLPFQEGQVTQNSGWQWSAFWNALSWTWFFQEDFTQNQCEDLKRFIVESGKNHPEQDLLVRRLNARLSAMMLEVSPDWAYLARIIARIKEIGLGYDLWYAQNVFWKYRFVEQKAGEVKFLLGF